MGEGNNDWKGNTMKAKMGERNSNKPDINIHFHSFIGFLKEKTTWRMKLHIDIINNWNNE